MRYWKKNLYMMMEESGNSFADINLLKPEEIKNFLDDYVIGQDEGEESPFCGGIQSL